jgi:hypothetical protein
MFHYHICCQNIAYRTFLIMSRTSRNMQKTKWNCKLIKLFYSEIATVVCTDGVELLLPSRAMNPAGLLT